MIDASPNSLLRLLREAGPRWHSDIAAGRDAMLAAYAPLLAAAPVAPLRSARDLAYGGDARQLLDLHAPPEAAGLPVMVFVHGGAFVRGDKAQTPWVYENVPLEFARHGFVAVNVEYRLAPQAAWPEGARDVRDAVLWVAQHIGAWGGDAARIFLFGHSAACAHCASATWDARVRPPQGLPVRGLVLASPRVVADLRPDNPNAHGVRAYYGEDASLHAERAPMAQLRADAPPTFVALAQYENPLIDFYGFELAHRLAQLCDAQGAAMPRFVQYPDHNHMSLLAQFNTPGNAFGADLRDWCARVERGEFAGRQGAPARGRSAPAGQPQRQARERAARDDRDHTQPEAQQRHGGNHGQNP
jgi:acetyl esterase